MMHLQHEPNDILNLDYRPALRPAQSLNEMDLSEGDLINVLSMFDPYGVWRLDIASQQVFWTDDVYRIHEMELGHGPVDLEHALSRYHTEDQVYLTQVLEEAVERRSAFRFVLRLKRKSEGYKLVKSTGRWRQTPQGRAELVGTFSEFQPANRAIAAVG